VLGVVMLLVAGAAVVAVLRLDAPLPVATVTNALTPPASTSFTAPALPWPTVGESAVAVPYVGAAAQSTPDERPVPIASLTKMMTAYVILHDHPLAVGQDGPMVTITQADLDDFDNDTVTDQANAQVVLGEQISERDLLGGMLVHSANNFAYTLALWDAGSLSAFVAKMNATAAQLGMDHTHYADASGYDQDSQSTPADLLKVAAPDMANPVFAGFVRMPSITLPVAGTLSTYTPLLGIQGVIGVKSGFTTVAGGCDVLAVMRSVHGVSTMVLTAVTGQQGLNVLGQAGLQALNLANATAKVVGAQTYVHQGEEVATVAAAGHTVLATAAGSRRFLTWPGSTVVQHLVVTRHVRPGAAKGTTIGSLVLTMGRQRQVVPVRLSRALPKESLTQRLF